MQYNVREWLKRNIPYLNNKVLATYDAPNAIHPKQRTVPWHDIISLTAATVERHLPAATRRSRWRQRSRQSRQDRRLPSRPPPPPGYWAQNTASQPPGKLLSTFQHWLSAYLLLNKSWTVFVYLFVYVFHHQSRPFIKNKFTNRLLTNRFY